MHEGSETALPARRGRHVQLGLGLVVGLGLLLWFLGGLQWRELSGVLAELSWGWVAVAVVLMLADYALHAWRWGVLVRHLDPDVRFGLLWRATAIGWGFNTLLPFRAGNFLRPAVVAVRRPVGYGTLLFTTIAEYVCDAFGIVLMLLWMLLLLPPSILEGGGMLAEVQRWGVWTTLAACGMLFAVVLSSTRQARGVAEFVASFLPGERPRQWVLRVFDQLVAGMAAVGNPLRLLEAMAITVLYWLFWLFAILATLRAFHVDLPLAGALFMEAALTLSMMVPQAPGFLGVFHVVTEEALSLWGTPVAQAQGVALVFWTVAFVPITIWGLVAGWREGLDLFGGKRALLQDLAAQNAGELTPEEETERRTAQPG